MKDSTGNKFTRAEMKALVVRTSGKNPSKTQLNKIIKKAGELGGTQVVRIKRAVKEVEAPKSKMMGLKQAPPAKPKRKYNKKKPAPDSKQPSIKSAMAKAGEKQKFKGGGMPLGDRHRKVEPNEMAKKKKEMKKKKAAISNPAYSNISPQASPRAAQAKSGGYNKPNDKMKCYMRKAKNGATYRACAEPEGDKKPKKQLRDKPKPMDKRTEKYKVAYPERNRGKPGETTPKMKKIKKRQKK